MVMFLAVLREEAKSPGYLKSQQEIIDNRTKFFGSYFTPDDYAFPYRTVPVSLENRQVALDWSRHLQELKLQTRVSVGPSPGKGNGLFAARAYKKGDVILMEKPLLAASVDEKACYHCIKITNKLVPGCNSCEIKCCSDECKENVKIYHICSKDYSKAINMCRNSKSSTPIGLLAVAKLFGYMKNRHLPESALLLDKLNGLILPTMEDTNAQLIIGIEESRFSIFAFSAGLKDYTYYRWFKEAESRFIKNSFSISYPKDPWTKLQGNGVVVYLASSMPNHDCRPNAATTFQQESMGGTMIMKAERDIKKGEEITVSYVPTDEKEEVRSKRLNVCYGFTCECELCKIERALQ